MIRASRRSFTLVELMVAVAIIAVIGAVTVIAVRTISRDVRLSSGENTVTAVLSNARGLAMKNNNVVLVVFRAKLIDEGKQVIEAVTAEFSGVSYVIYDPSMSPNPAFIDRFVPVPTVAVRELPEGIKIGVPQYALSNNDDTDWDTCTDLPALRPPLSEAAGVMPAVMYAPDGTTVVTNPRTDSHRIFVDFDNDTFQRQGSGNFDNINNSPNNNGYCEGVSGLADQYFCQAQEHDEPYVTFAPFITVYDDEHARTLYDLTSWNNATNRALDLSEYINDNANRIHFNRYTGVIMPTEDR